MKKPIPVIQQFKIPFNNLLPHAPTFYFSFYTQCHMLQYELIAMNITYLGKITNMKEWAQNKQKMEGTLRPHT